MTNQRGVFVDLNAAETGATAQEGRLALGGFLGRTTAGVARTGVMIDGMQPVVTGTGDNPLTYQIRPCVIVTKVSDANGPVVVANRSTQSVTTTPAPNTGARIDAVYALHRHVSGDGGSGTTDNDLIFGVVQGNVAATPSPPNAQALPAGATRLANVTVTANATSTSGLTFSRAHDWVPANGGIVPNGPNSGLVWNGTAMVPIGYGETDLPTPTPGVNVDLTHATVGTSLKKIAGWIDLVVSVRATAALPNQHVVMTLPAAALPDRARSIPVAHTAGGLGQGALLQLNTNGQIVTVGPIPNNETRRGGIVYRAAS